jgi:hypothetical protein
MVQTSTLPIEATRTSDDASYSITCYLADLIEAAGERSLTMLRYLVVAALANRFPDHADAIRFRTKNDVEASPGQQGDVLFNDAVFYVAEKPRELDFTGVVLNASAGRIVYLLVPSDHELVLRKYAENHQSGIYKQASISSVEQFISLLLYRMARFDHNEALRQLRRLLVKYNELVTRYENDPSLKIVIPDFGVD